MYELKNGQHWLNPCAADGPGLPTRDPPLLSPPHRMLPLLRSAQGNDLCRLDIVSFLLGYPVASFGYYSSLNDFRNLEHCGEDMFRSVRAELLVHVSDLLQAEMEVAIADIKSGKYKDQVVLTVDATYPVRGHNSRHCSADVFCKNNGCLIAVAHASYDAPKGYKLTLPWPGAARSSEAFCVEVLLNDLNTRCVPCDYIVFDGDSSCALKARSVFRHTRVIDCFNHDLKTRAKNLILAFAKRKSAGIDCVCVCGSSPHKWRAQPPCGCANDAHAHSWKGLVHMAAIKARDSVPVFVDHLTQFKRHFRGDHSTCTFHAKRKCSGAQCSPKLPCRQCSCGACKTGDKLECWGDPIEADCEDSVEWTSRLPVISCPYHAAVLDAAIDDLIANSPQLIISARGIGKVDTCRNESAHATVSLTRGKGFNMGWEWYAVSTVIGFLRANRVSYMLLQQQRAGASVSTIKREWLFELQLYDLMGLPISEAFERKVFSEAHYRIQRSVYCKTEKAKYKKIKTRQKTALRNAQRTQFDGGRSYGRDSNRAVSAAAGGSRNVERFPAVNSITITIDLEHPAFCPYHDPIMELAAVVDRYHSEAFVPVQIDELGRFHEYSRVACVNTRVPTNEHVNIAEMRLKQSEEELIGNFVLFLKAVIPGDVPTMIVAHNGKACDYPAISRALNRHGYNEKALFAELNIIGLVDTLILSKHVVPWTTMAAPDDSVVPYDFTESFLWRGAARVPITKKSQPVGDLELLSLSDDDEDVCELVESQAVLDSETVDAPLLYHSLEKVYERLFKQPLTGAHEAINDVLGLRKILHHDTIWDIVHGQNVVIRIDKLHEHARENYNKNTLSFLGWCIDQPDYPQCAHGWMLPKRQKMSKSSTSPAVHFVCRAEVCPQMSHGPHSTYIPPAPKSSKNGEPGACRCSGKCATTSCPCKEAQQSCGDGCRHTSKTDECKNRGQVADAAPSVPSNNE